MIVIWKSGRSIGIQWMRRLREGRSEKELVSFLTFDKSKYERMNGTNSNDYDAPL